jgi:hypothetical protein
MVLTVIQELRWICYSFDSDSGAKVDLSCQNHDKSTVASESLSKPCQINLSSWITVKTMSNLNHCQNHVKSTLAPESVRAITNQPQLLNHCQNHDKSTLAPESLSKPWQINLSSWITVKTMTNQPQLLNHCQNHDKSTLAPESLSKPWQINLSSWITVKTMTNQP